MGSLTFKNLSKRYGGTMALDRGSLTLRPAIYGLFGRNGAGKSTLLSVIADRLLASGGSVELDDENDTRLSRVVLWYEACRLSHVVVANRRPWASGQ